MYPEGLLNAPSTLHGGAATLESGYRIAAGAGAKEYLRAENFDILYDSPVEASNFKQILFEVNGVPHRIVIDGDGNFDPETCAPT